MESVLEQQRRLHEERERLMESMIREYMHKKQTHKEAINSDHRLKILMDRYVDASSLLGELYEDRDRSRKAEVNALSGPNEYAEFYTRYKALKEFRKKHPDEISVPMSLEFEMLNRALEDPERIEENMVEFTDEEGYGKYIDLHECYSKYVNLKGVEKVDYVTYLTIFDRVFDIPKDRKNPEYKRYLEALLDYLMNFLRRVQPLLDMHEEIEKAMKDFDEKFDSGNFPGWSKDTTTSGALAHAGAYLDLSPFNSPEELKPLGLDRLKSALIALGLKCGGNLDERAHRLFATKGRRLNELDKSLFAKQAGSGAKTGPEADKTKQQKGKEIGILEAQFYHFVELVSEQRNAAKENVERKQARGGMEDEEDTEMGGGAAGGYSDDEDEDDVPYNPKNLPLGWDGKPIPYWLYKLHGLNISYPCEICGNAIYKGPKAFQRHFSEWRHANGMRCLNIPNTAHFANITKIADAVALWQKLSYEKEQERFKPELEEEFEDAMGNVVTRTVFDDMKRQGLM